MGIRSRKARDYLNLRFPRVFSFIDNPDETLGVLESLVRAGANRGAETIHIAQDRCELIDLGAEAVASVFAMEADKTSGIRFEGVFPADQEQREIVKAVGLPRNLGLEFVTPSEFITFDLRRGRRGMDRAYELSERDRVTEDLVDYVNECLTIYDWQLSSDQKGFLAGLVGEVIANAEDHSRRPHWWVCAYLRQPKGQSWGDCHITIFNFGRTLAESLRSLPQDAMLRTDIERLVDKHRGRGFFEKGKWQTDDLWTLYALQGRVSRKNVAPDSVGDHGQGTADMIQYFHELGQSPHAISKMCLVSGRTHLLFDGTYSLKRFPDGRRIIAFNPGNDLAERPDEKYVQHLSQRFPGTLISMRFYFDQEHLDAVAERRLVPR